MAWIPGKPRDGARYGVAFGKSSPSPPPAPDPTATIAAQTAANKDAVQESARVNQINEVSPFGSVSYTGDIGSPDRTRTVSLAPDQQAALDKQNALTSSLYGLANDQTGRIAGNIAQPFSFAGMPGPATADTAARQNAENAAYGRATARLDPQFGTAENQLRTRLANQGIMAGSEAFNNEMRDFNFAKNDAYSSARNDAVATGDNEMAQNFGLQSTARQNAIQEANFLREQPLNEASALMSGGQINQPNFANPAQYQVAPADAMGAYGLQAGSQNAAFQARTAANSANNSAMAGLGGAALTGAAIFF